MTDALSLLRTGTSAITGPERGSSTTRAARASDTTPTGNETTTNETTVDELLTSEESSTDSASPSTLATKETFLTLLVAQIKNQNPLNPADGTEFLTQLAQFTQLEQLISIREELEAMGKHNQALLEASTETAT